MSGIIQKKDKVWDFTDNERIKEGSVHTMHIEIEVLYS